MWRVKICGITRPADAVVAAEAGADAIGLVFAESPRRVTEAQAAAVLAALPPSVEPVALFVNEAPDQVLRLCRTLGIGTVQLHGEEPPEVAREVVKHLRVVKAFRIREEADLAALAGYPADAYLLDSRVKGRRGGTGVAFDWRLAAQANTPIPILLAGGLTPDNVAEAIGQAHPSGVDTSSGVEAAPGVKDPARVRAFVAAASAALGA